MLQVIKWMITLCMKAASREQLMPAYYVAMYLHAYHILAIAI